MIEKKINLYSLHNIINFYLFIIMIGYLGYLLLRPFLISILLAVVLVMTGNPIYIFLLKHTNQRRGLSSAITCLIIFLLIAVPFIIIAGIIAEQALNVYMIVTNLLKDEDLIVKFRDRLDYLIPYIQFLLNFLGFSQRELFVYGGNILCEICNSFYVNLIIFIKGFSNLIIEFAEIILIAFYLFIDGSAIVSKLFKLLPFPQSINGYIQLNFYFFSRSIFSGTVLLAIIQGIISGVGFMIFQIPNSFFWGSTMILASVVPLIGTAIVWGPVSLYLLIMGYISQAVGVIIWCFLSNVFCDSILRSKFIGRGMMHPLLVFFSILSGVSIFGFLGLILGPLMLALIFILLEVYQSYLLIFNEEGVVKLDIDNNVKVEESI